MSETDIDEDEPRIEAEADWDDVWSETTELDYEEFSSKMSETDIDEDNLVLRQNPTGMMSGVRLQNSTTKNY